ncbi:NAD-dependent epimerase/dehydratase family protein [Filobacillus milosensis]|nr:NAD-dependent epimerase/dehydratase family protein [Filobacillus milosensis]
MKVFIIGGTNFMGPHVVNILNERGHEVLVFHRGNHNIDLKNGVEELLGNREELEKYREQIKAFNPDVVLDMICMFERNVEQLEKALEGIVKRLVLISSADVYRAFEVINKVTEGPIQPMPLKEDSELRTQRYPFKGKMDNDFANEYDKIPVEEKAMGSDKFDTTILRLPMVYGANDPNRRFMSYIHRMNDNRPHLVLDERLANARYSMSFSKNVAHAIVMAIENQDMAGHTLNISDNDTVPVLEWVKRIAKLMEWDGNIVVAKPGEFQDEIGMNTDQDLVIDSSLIREQFNYKEVILLNEGLRETIVSELNHPPEEDLAKMFDYEKEDEVVALSKK